MSSKPKVNVKKLLTMAPVLLAKHGEFVPTRLMALCVWIWVRQHTPQARKLLGVGLPEDERKKYESEDFLSLREVVVGVGACRQNIESWRRKKGFEEWRQAAVRSLITKDGLERVHINLQAQAERGRDSSIMKLYLQRFDPEYVERSSQDQRLSFKGYEPAGADRSRDRQRKVLAERAERLPVESVQIEIPVNGFEPDGQQTIEENTPPRLLVEQNGSGNP